MSLTNVPTPLNNSGSITTTLILNPSSGTNNPGQNFNFVTSVVISDTTTPIPNEVSYNFSTNGSVTGNNILVAGGGAANLVLNVNALFAYQQFNLIYNSTNTTPSYIVTNILSQW